MKYQIISDGSCDLLTDYTEKNNVKVVPFYVSFDDENYFKEGVDISQDDFYKRVVDEHLFPKSSLPSVQDFIDAFTPYVEEGTPIICICITTKFSGSYQSAMNAKNIILETNPNAVITVIDSQINTVLQGIYVNEAVRMRDNGYSYEDTIKRLEEIKTTGRIFFTIGNLEYLRKGGRMGKLLTIAGDKLGIRPIITLKEGEIFPSGIARSRAKSIAKVVETTKNHFESNHLDPNKYSICIGTGFQFEEAHELAAMIEKAVNVKIDFWSQRIGATIGVHTGPYPVGVALVEKAF